MSLERFNFDEIGKDNLQALIDTGVPEGTLLEYKGVLYGRSDADVKEFLKDTSSFANTLGGHLIIGMKEQNGLPISLAPVVELDLDKEVQRLESLMRDGITPRISGVLMRAVPIFLGGAAIVIRIPRSWNPPHQVSARNTNRFYIRNSAGAHEASVDELRVLFNVSASALDRTRAFRQERLAKVSTGEGPVVLDGARGRVILHIVPLAAFSGRQSVDLARARVLAQSFGPMASRGYNLSFNFDGFITVRGGQTCHGYTQLFRNGCLEAVKVGAITAFDKRSVIPSNPIEQHVIESLANYLDGLKALNVPPPLICLLTLDGVHGAYLGVPRSYPDFEDFTAISYNTLLLPECVIEDYGTRLDYERAIRPAFDALWNAGGYSSALSFDADGRWNPNFTI